MKKLIIWGTEIDYDRYVNSLQFEIYKKNISIEALVSRDAAYSYLDGYKVIKKEDINDIEFDYLVIANQGSYNSIVKDALNLNIDRHKIINGEVFLLPFFDFSKYILIKESNISIISDDCWGAYTYNYLNLPFLSPFILLHFSKEDYLELLMHFEDYMNSPLYKEEYHSNGWPVGSLQNSVGHKIHLNFNHAMSFEEAKADWERRLQRLNHENLFIKMTIDSDENAEIFNNLQHKNKLGFYNKDLNLDSILYLPESNNLRIKQKVGWQFDAYVLRSSDKSTFFSKPYNIFDLLTNGNSMIRKQ